MVRTKIIPGETIVREQIKSSSSNNIYTVTIYDNCVSCTCPAGGKRMLCKHVIEVVHRNFEKIKKQSPDFFAALMEFIKARNDESIDRDLLKQYTKKIIYVNKEITKKAYNNKLNLDFADEEPSKEPTQNCKVPTSSDFKNCPKCGCLYDKSFKLCPTCNKTVEKEISTGCLSGLIFGLALTFSIVKMSLLPLIIGIIICIFKSPKFQNSGNKK